MAGFAIEQDAPAKAVRVEIRPNGAKGAGKVRMFFEELGRQRGAAGIFENVGDGALHADGAACASDGPGEGLVEVEADAKVVLGVEAKKSQRMLDGDVGGEKKDGGLRAARQLPVFFHAEESFDREVAQRAALLVASAGEQLAGDGFGKRGVGKRGGGHGLMARGRGLGVESGSKAWGFCGLGGCPGAGLPGQLVFFVKAACAGE